jgi:hypothetical protein
MIGNWRALHNEKLNKFYSPPNIFRMISKKIKMRWAEHIVRMSYEKYIQEFDSKI